MMHRYTICEILHALISNGTCTELGSVAYHVMVQTGDEFRCGTNANVSITVYGTNGDSGKRPLSHSWRKSFERNQKDDFELDIVDLGKSKSKSKSKYLLTL